MTDKTQDMFPFECQTVLDYMSVIGRINTESDNYNSRNLQSQTDTSLQRDDSNLQGPVSDLACPSRQSSEYQNSTFDPSVSRPMSDYQLSTFDPAVSRSMSDYQHSTFDPAVSRRSMNEYQHSTFDPAVSRKSMSEYQHSTFDPAVSGSMSDYLHSTFDPPVSRRSMGEYQHSTFDPPVSRRSKGEYQHSSCDPVVSGSSMSEYQHSTFDPSVSRSMSEFQHSTFDPEVSRRSMKDQRSHSFSSWCALLNIQNPGSQKHRQNDMKSEMRSLFRSLLTMVPFGNFSSGAAGKMDTFTTSVTESFLYAQYVPGESIKHVQTDSCQDIRTESFGDTPSDLLSDVSANSFTEIPIDSFKDITKDCLTDVSSVLHKDIDINVYKETQRDSIKNIHVQSLKDTPEVSLKHTLRSSLSENKTDFSSTDVASTSEDTLDVKQPAVSGDNTGLYFPAEHEFMETTPSLIQNPQTSTAKQETPLPQSTSVSLLGILANYLLIGPCVLAFWNSTWCFFDYILLDLDCQISFWVSAVIGFPCLVAATLLQNSLLSYSVKCNNIVRFITSRTYMYIVSVACVSHWRSVWTIAYCYMDISLLNSALTFATVFLVLLFSRCLVCTLAPPVSIAMDLTHAEHYKRDTFRRKTVCILDGWMINGLR